MSAVRWDDGLLVAGDRLLARVADVRQPEGAPIIDGATVTRTTFDAETDVELGRSRYGGIVIALPATRRSLFIGRRDARVPFPSSWWWLPRTLRRMR